MNKSPCETPFFQWLDKLNRPVTRWGFSIVAVAYGARAVLGADFDPMAFAALVAPAGFTYWRRGDEKLKGIE